MESTTLQDQSFDWLVGSEITEIDEVAELQWRIRLSNGGECSVNAGFWRLSADNGVISSSEANGTYWRGEPFDSVEEALPVVGRTILSATVRQRAPDLVIAIDGGFELELVAMSKGGECWQLNDPDGNILVVYGTRNCDRSSD